MLYVVHTPCEFAPNIDFISAESFVDVASIGLMDKIKDTDSHFCNTQESFLPEEYCLVINKQRRVKGLLIKGFKIELMSNTRTPVSLWLGLYKMLLPFDYYAFFGLQLICAIFNTFVN